MNRVVIVGGDHHNGLGLARAFGKNGIPVDSVVVNDVTKSFLSKSKYVNNCYVFQDEKSAFDYIKKAYSDAKEKVILIPYSDSAAKELDIRLDEFKDDFYLPSINMQKGKISQLMNKKDQYDFVTANGIKMAKTMELKIDAETKAPTDFPIPCIIKPVVSAEGDKKDITVCNSKEELAEAINKYFSLGYHRALLQEYLKIDYEIDVFGCILKNELNYCIVPTHTIRSWPPNGGTNSFSFIITDKTLVAECENIIRVLKDIGFYGLYDIEIFVVDDKIYLNEINFRNSGDVYMALNQQYYYPVAWYYDVLGEKYNISLHPEKGDYCMTECADIRHAVFKDYSLLKWFKDYRKCSDYALKFKGDMRPAYCRYLYYFKKIILRK